MLSHKKIKQKTDYTAAKGNILWYLETINRPVKRPELLQHLHNSGHIVSDRRMRLLIVEMIELDGYCLQSSKAGYCLIQTSDQFAKATKYLHKKSLGILMHEYWLTRNWNRKTSTLIPA